MKKLCYSAFIAFWSSVATVLALHALATDKKSTDSTLPGYTLQQLAEHTSREDCWLAIESKVYDVTGYIPQHPAPPGVILPWCGKEATEGMRTKGYGRDHSPNAWKLLQGYLIGNLESKQ